jgi:hypothetical protein
MEFPQPLPVPQVEIIDDKDRELSIMAEIGLEYIRKFSWVCKVESATIFFGVPGIIVLIIVSIEPIRDDIDKNLWVVTGNIPNAYFVTDRARNAFEALEVYCEMMKDWSSGVIAGDDLSNFFPVFSSPTIENARDLQGRIEFIEENVLPLARMDQ